LAACASPAGLAGFSAAAGFSPSGFASFLAAGFFFVSSAMDIEWLVVEIGS
jgi:hypothetical protein